MSVYTEFFSMPLHITQCIHLTISIGPRRALGIEKKKGFWVLNTLVMQSNHHHVTSFLLKGELIIVFLKSNLVSLQTLNFYY